MLEYFKKASSGFLMKHSDPKKISSALARKKEKIKLYNKYSFHLIQLKDEDVQNLDDILPRLFLEFGEFSW